MHSINLVNKYLNYNTRKLALSVPYIIAMLMYVGFSPFLLTAIYISTAEIWRDITKDPNGYHNWNRLRIEWNKASCKRESAVFYYDSPSRRTNKKTKALRGGFFLLCCTGMRFVCVENGVD
jgi:hypothetical protein